MLRESKYLTRSIRTAMIDWILARFAANALLIIKPF
jgi:hypothetical protein